MNSGAQGLAALLNIFAGGAFSRASVFALGIMPYISASIVMQLMGIAVPAIQKMQREGESGRKKINQYTRLLTIAITLFQAPSYISTQIPAQAVVAGDGSLMSFWGLSTVLLLVTGTIFVMWLGERITDKGIGNGISMIIMIGIIAQLPSSFAFRNFIENDRWWFCDAFSRNGLPFACDDCHCCLGTRHAEDSSELCKERWLAISSTVERASIFH